MSNKDNYIGSEDHYQDLLKAARKAPFDHPETLTEAVENVRFHFNDLIGKILAPFFKIYDITLLKLGFLLIKRQKIAQPPKEFTHDENGCDRN